MFYYEFSTLSFIKCSYVYRVGRINCNIVQSLHCPHSRSVLHISLHFLSSDVFGSTGIASMRQLLPLVFGENIKMNVLHL